MENNTYLAHYGILGMKWGVRRYQNEDGSLTAAGRARYTNSDGSLNKAGRKFIREQYKQTSTAASKRFATQYAKLHNESVDIADKKMRDGGTDSFNNEQKKKYGENYMNRIGYQDDYNIRYETVFRQALAQKMNELYLKDSDYRKSKALEEKYRMWEWDALAKENHETYQTFVKPLLDGNIETYEQEYRKHTR